MRTFIAFMATLLVAVLLVGGCARPPQQAATPDQPGMQQPAPPAAGQQIRMVGSTTLLPLAQKWSEGFRAANPGANIAVSGGGSGNGIEALTNGSAEIADSSREIKDKEVEAAKAKGINPLEHLVAHDGIAVIVHPDNPLTEISLQKLSDIYTGEIKKWDEIGGKGLGDIQVINRDSSSGTYESFKELVVQLHGKQKERDYAPGTINQTSNEAIASLVAQGKTAIGYVGLAYLKDSVKALKVIGIKGGAGEAATAANVVSGKYPIARELYLYTNGEPTGMLAEYITWIKSPAGQALVTEVGFVPLSK